MIQNAKIRPERLFAFVRHLWSDHRVWLIAAAILALVSFIDPPQGAASLGFVAAALVTTAPFLLMSIGLASYASATGADGLIARAFIGAPVVMIFAAAFFGGLSPFCSCGVIPLIAGLLVMGVPLSAVMAFWLASPVIDPAMFALTVGVLGVEFAIAKTVTAVGLGVSGGLITLTLTRNGAFADPLREGVGNGGCGASVVRTPKRPVWAFWHETDRRVKFLREATKTTLFLAKWLTLAFLLESMMVAYVPTELVAKAVGGEGIGAIMTTTLVGVPAYLNGYAALPLVSGLVAQGMAPGAGLAFLVAGGVTSLPAAIAVWALAKRAVFFLYVAFALSGSMVSGLLFQAWIGA